MSLVQPRPFYRLSGKWALTQLSTGQPFFVDVESRDLTVWIVLVGQWENFVDDVLSALAKPGDTFLDIGSNVGYYAVKIGGIVGKEGMVHAFEPNPDLFDFVKENLTINGYYGFKAHNVALAHKAGEMTMTYDRAHPGGGTVLLNSETGSDTMTNRVVQVAVLDELLPDIRADLIKIDIEGFEPLAFAGMKAVLARSPDAAIVTEISQQHWSRFGSPIEMLRVVAGHRRIFRIWIDGGLTELNSETLDVAFEEGFVSYVLMLPPGEAHESRIRHLIRPV